MSMSSDFVKNLWANLYAKSGSIYCLKHAFGNSVSSSDINTYMSFLDVSGNNFPDKQKEVYFLVATMFYNFERPNQAEKDNRTFVTFEKLISRIYGKSKSTDKMIRNFIDSDFDSNGIFVNRLVRLSGRCKKELHNRWRLSTEFAIQTESFSPFSTQYGGYPLYYKPRVTDFDFPHYIGDYPFNY